MKINASNVGPLYKRVVIILDDASARVVRVVNSEMVLAYWHIGREITSERGAGTQDSSQGM